MHAYVWGVGHNNLPNWCTVASLAARFQRVTPVDTDDSVGSSWAPENVPFRWDQRGSCHDPLVMAFASVEQLLDGVLDEEVLERFSG